MVEAADFIIGNKCYHSCFPWNDRLALFIFEEISVRYSGMNNHSLSIFISSKNDILWEKLLDQLTDHSFIKNFSLRQPLHLDMQQKYIIPTQGPLFNKINTFYTMTASVAWCHCLDSCQGTCSFNHHRFCANDNWLRKANNGSVLFWE